MQSRAVLPIVFSAAVLCGKKSETLGEFPLPPAKPETAPEFFHSLSLLYPGALLFRVPPPPKNESPGVIVQKTLDSVAKVADYYKQVLKNHGFSELTSLVNPDEALLSYVRHGKTTENLQVRIQKLPYGGESLIRIERTQKSRE
ncbi:MAG: hypothetical protein N2Z22_10845 [Turneriella sp.]|nr:hypothetical protein [Turneriella sp.]